MPQKTRNKMRKGAQLLLEIASIEGPSQAKSRQAPKLVLPGVRYVDARTIPKLTQ